MPVFQKKTLRQRLGRDFLRDTQVGNVSNSLAANLGSVFLLDANQANLAFSGENLYERIWILHNGMELRVASFNAGSGAFIALQTNATVVASGGEYELHELLSPTEKNRAIDQALLRMRTRQLVGIAAVADTKRYVIDNAASPHRITDVLDAYYLSDPTGTLSRKRNDFVWWRVVATATGNELMVEPAPAASTQVVLDALLQLTLSSTDTATINIPSDDWLLWGAAAQCYHLLTRRAPVQDVGVYRQFQQEAAREFSRLATRFAPLLDQKIQLDEAL